MLTELEILDLLSDYHEGRLDRVTQQAVEEGLQRYPSARRALAELRNTIRLVSALPKLSAPPGLSANISRRAAARVRLSQAGREILSAQARQARLTFVLRFLPAAAALVIGCLASLVVWRVQTTLQHSSERRTVTAGSATQSPETYAAEPGTGQPISLIQPSHELGPAPSSPTHDPSEAPAPEISPTSLPLTDSQEPGYYERQNDIHGISGGNDLNNQSKLGKFSNERSTADTPHKPQQADHPVQHRRRTEVDRVGTLEKRNDIPEPAEKEVQTLPRGVGGNYAGFRKPRDNENSKQENVSGVLHDGMHDGMHDGVQTLNSTSAVATFKANPVSSAESIPEQAHDNIKTLATARNFQDSRCYGGAVLVRGDPGKVYALMREALARLETAGHIRFYNPPERLLPGQVPSLEVTTDDPSVLFQVLALLPRSPDVDSVNFVPTPEAVLALRQSLQGLSAKQAAGTVNQHDQSRLSGVGSNRVGVATGGAGLSPSSSDVPPSRPAPLTKSDFSAPGTPAVASPPKGNATVASASSPVVRPNAPSAEPNAHSTGPLAAAGTETTTVTKIKKAVNTQSIADPAALTEPINSKRGAGSETGAGDTTSSNTTNNGQVASTAEEFDSRRFQREQVQRQSEAVVRLLLPLFGEAGTTPRFGALLSVRETVRENRAGVADVAPATGESVAVNVGNKTALPEQPALGKANVAIPAESQDDASQDKAISTPTMGAATNKGTDNQAPAVASRLVTVRILFQNSRNKAVNTTQP